MCGILFHTLFLYLFLYLCDITEKTFNLFYRNVSICSSIERVNPFVLAQKIMTRIVEHAIIGEVADWISAWLVGKTKRVIYYSGSWRRILVDVSE